MADDTSATKAIVAALKSNKGKLAIAAGAVAAVATSGSAPKSATKSTSTTTTPARNPTLITGTPDQEVPRHFLGRAGSVGLSRGGDVLPTQQEIDRLLTEGFEGNLLGDVDQPTYHFRLFMLESTEFQEYATSGKLAEQIEGRKRYILAETGVTALNIREVTLENVVGPGFRNRNVNLSKMVITITEPMGTSFFDIIYKAAIELRIENFNKVPYYLELSFRGYQSDSVSAMGPTLDGAPDLNVCASLDNNGRWLWQIAITDIEADFGVGGTTYTLTCTLYNELTLEDELQRLPENLTITARTVQQCLDQVANALNKSIYERYGNYPMVFYNIVCEPVGLPTGSYTADDFTLRGTDKKDVQRGNTFSGETGKVTAHFARGTTLTDIIELTYLHSDAAQKLLTGVNAADKIDFSNQQATEKRFRDSYIFRVEPDTRIGEYDPISGLYQRTATLHVWVYSTKMPMLSMLQIADAADPQGQVNIINSLKRGGFLKKRYDYLFTGMNTEVSKLDLKYNLAWMAALPRFEGLLNSYDNVGVGPVLDYRKLSLDIQNLVAEKRKNQAAIEVLSKVTKPNSKLLDHRDKLSQDEQTALAGITKTNGKGIATVDEAKQFLTAFEARQKKVDEQLDKWQVQANDKREEYRARQAHGPLGGPKLNFAEEISRARVIDDKFYLPISISQDSEDPRFQTTGGLIGANDNRNKSFYGAALDQLYGPWSKQLINISLEIRGDPYWIGPSNLDRRPKFNNPAYQMRGLVDWTAGDNHFLLTFSYPDHLDDTGYPEFKTPGVDEKNVFNGVYAVRKVTHTFSNGQFTQQIDALRVPLVDALKALGVLQHIDPIRESTPGGRGGV